MGLRLASRKIWPCILARERRSCDKDNRSVLSTLSAGHAEDRRRDHEGEKTLEKENITSMVVRHPLRFGFAAITVLASVFVYYFRKEDISTKVAEWGQVGDYFGGLLNPIFGLISVVLVAATLRSQTQAAARQAFENQFFTLLNLHSSVLQSIDRRLKNGDVKYGRDCFRLFYRKIVSISQREGVSMKTAYQRFIEKDGWEIEHYFRTVYHLFKHVKEGQSTIEATEAEKKRYYDLIKSQLSQYELVILWLNVESLNRGNWDSILNEPQAQPFEHLNQANLIENPTPNTVDELEET